MEGYDVVTSDDCGLGKVVGVRGGNLIVEHGTLRKSRHAVPETFAHTDDAEHVVRLSVSKQIVEDSPKVDGDTFDEQAIAAHYGLAGGFEAPETEGYGETLPDDPAWSAAEEAQRLGVETAEQQRAQAREALAENPAAKSEGFFGPDRPLDARQPRRG